MDRIRIATWTLLVSAPLACMCARKETKATSRGTVTASMLVHADPLALPTAAAAEPEGTGGTSAHGGASAGGHAGKNTRNGKDDHDTQ